MKQVEEITEKLDESWVNNSSAFSQLYYLIFKSEALAPDWESIPDYKQRLQAIKTRANLKWYTKRKIKIEEILWITDNKNLTLIHNDLNKAGLTDKNIFPIFKEIMENAWRKVPTKEGVFVAPYNEVRNDALKFYSKLKDYLEDDTQENIFNLFKVDNQRLDLILWLPK